MPLATQFFPELEDAVLLLDGPFVTANTRVDHVDPTLTALPRFSLAARSNRLVKLFSNTSPLFGLIQIAAHALRGNILSDFFENLSLACRPRRLLTLDVLDEQPAFLALEGGAPWY